ncbi:hypothetical protein [Streptomyces sp. PRh5]|uniref:hypothetical protein n=1 Tax=Streptomyces sp. PRh5 TaxID=1158056 RepID=UPI0004B9B0C6|nr:hypothetical protein [Streptomyces sp. PRh5]
MLDAVWGTWTCTGEFGSGVTLKYIANLLIGIHTAATAEALWPSGSASTWTW